MRRLVLILAAGLAACHGGGGKPAPLSKTVKEAEALVQKLTNDKTIKFNDVQTVGADATQKTCGYFTRPNSVGGTDSVRFIAFTSGNGGENPFIDDAHSPYPLKKSEFADAWKACVRDGYTDPNAPDPAAEKPSKKKKKRTF